MSFPLILVQDWETSGLLRDSDSERSYLRGPQGIEIGAVIVETQTWTQIGEFTSRVRFEDSHTWDSNAESIHGITRSHLCGAPSSRVVADQFDHFLGQFFQKNVPIMLAGQNPGFDRWFTNQLFFKRDPNLGWRFHSRMIDTFTLGFLRWGCTTGDHLYQTVCGRIRTRHSALEDTRLTAEVLCKGFGLNIHSSEGLIDS